MSGPVSLQVSFGLDFIRVQALLAGSSWQFQSQHSCYWKLWLSQKGLQPARFMAEAEQPLRSGRVCLFPKRYCALPWPPWHGWARVMSPSQVEQRWLLICFPLHKNFTVASSLYLSRSFFDIGVMPSLHILCDTNLPRPCGLWRIKLTWDMFRASGLTPCSLS